MAVSPDLQNILIDRLTIEALSVLVDLYKSKSTSSVQDATAWLQHTIAVFEEQNELAKAMAANIVLKAFADEWTEHGTFQVEQMEGRVRKGIYQAVNS